MKRILCAWCLLVVFLFHAEGQTVPAPGKLEVSVNKTISLLFPSPILSFDRGSQHILVQKATANVLKVKADTAFSDTTNLTIITHDGKLYSFLVSYAPSPAALMINLGARANLLQDTLLLAFAGRIREAEGKLHGVRYAVGGMLLQAQGVYANGNQVGVKLKVDNRSSLAYEIGALHAAVSGGRSGHRRAVQTRELPLLLTDMEMTTVRERQACRIVVILPKAALTTGQALQIRLDEKGSDRQLTVSIPSKFIVNATLLK